MPSPCAAAGRVPARSGCSRGGPTLGLRLDRSHGCRKEVGHGLAQLTLRDAHAFIVEVLLHLAEHVLVTLLDQVRFAHGLDIFVHICPREAQLLRRPLRQQAVATRRGAELELLVQGKFLLEGSLPLFEAGHGAISTDSACSWDVLSRIPQRHYPMGPSQSITPPSPGLTSARGGVASCLRT